MDGATPTTNYGTSTTLRTDASLDLHSYLRFDAQGLSRNVTSATLRIYANSSSSVGYTVSSVSDNTWTETGITYDTAPPAPSGREHALVSRRVLPPQVIIGSEVKHE